MENYLQACIVSALAGGDAIKDFVPCLGKEKNDALGHHAIVTDADYISQKAILECLVSIDNSSYFMTEEIVPELLKDRSIKKQDLDRLKDSGVYIIDELDGTSSKSIGHYEWSISVGYVKDLEHIAGAVYAPEIYGGALFYASKDNGAFQNSSKKKHRLNVKDNMLQDSYVIFGVDSGMKIYPVHNKLLNELSDRCRTINFNGSCALPLALVAAGHADALIQPLVYPWDYAAGKVIVEQAGGKMIFYEINDNKIIPIEKLEPRHYDPEKRKLGFVAANETLSNEIISLML